jgi:uncharacterized protein YsxB (DUF464 family)
MGQRSSGPTYGEEEKVIEINLNTARFKMTVKGHANPDESSEYQAICNSVSALAQGMVYSVSKYHKDEEPLRTFEYRNDPGDLLLRAWPEEWAEIGIRRRFRIYGDGLELLAKSHPECVTMIWDGERILPESEEGHE